MNTLTYQQIEYLQYCVKETASKDGKAGTQEVRNLKNRLAKMKVCTCKRAALERKKMKAYQECVLDRDPTDDYCYEG